MLFKNKWNQLALFLLILGVNLIIFSIIALGTTVLFWKSMSMENPAVARYSNALIMLGAFGFTALLHAFIVNQRKPFAYLQMNKGVQWKTVLLLVLVFCASMPVLSWIIKWNEGLHLPQFLSAVEQWMREYEDQAALLTKRMLSGTSLSVLCANLLAIAVVPAVCEELLFRGVLLSWLKNSFHRKHLAVWLSAVVFSAFHVQFFGFFPRMLLGVYLGYLYLWSGSLWTPIIAHFLNNAVAVVAAFFYNIGYISVNYEEFGNGGEQIWAVVLSFCVTGGLIVVLWRKRIKG